LLTISKWNTKWPTIAITGVISVYAQNSVVSAIAMFQ